MQKTLLIITLLSCTPRLIAFKHFVLIAAPGSGKGTLSQYLVSKYGYVHVCPGDSFRKEIREQTPLGKKIKSIVESGEYVDKELVCTLVLQSLIQVLHQNKCFILDGFPRAKISFDFLHQFFKKHNLLEDVCFIQLKSNENTCIERIVNRIICVGCSMVYNHKFAAPKQINICNSCSGKLISRTADTEKIAKKRLDFFHAEIEPLLKTAKKFYEVITIETECSIRNLREKYETLVERTQSARTT